VTSVRVLYRLRQKTDQQEARSKSTDTEAILIRKNITAKTMARTIVTEAAQERLKDLLQKGGVLTSRA
jgi:hypothetical protein